MARIRGSGGSHLGARVQPVGLPKGNRRVTLIPYSVGAQDCLNEYFEEIGGRPDPKKRKGRKSTAAESGSATPVTNKRLKKEKEWSPPPGSWEHDVNYVDTVEEQKDPQTGKKARYAYLVWVNQKKTQHPLAHTYQKCPQKMLEYYEKHLVFSTNEHDDATNGDDNNVMMKDTDDLC
jgi:chromobox protein 1